MAEWIRGLEDEWISGNRKSSFLAFRRTKPAKYAQNGIKKQKY